MIKRKSFGIKRTKKRRKSGEVTLLKKKLWQLCRALNPETTCYTCGRQNLEGSSRQLGHYIASSLCSVELRFDLKNLRICCYNCNINKSGNTLQFQRNLIRDHGTEYVEELWTRNEATKGKTYPLSWFFDKITEYQGKLDKTLETMPNL